jgi:hypothetical protein
LLEEPALLSENGHSAAGDGGFSSATGTDFLLAIEIPSWGEVEEREVL